MARPRKKIESPVEPPKESRRKRKLADNQSDETTHTSIAVQESQTSIVPPDHAKRPTKRKRKEDDILDSDEKKPELPSPVPSRKKSLKSTKKELDIGSDLEKPEKPEKRGKNKTKSTTKLPRAKQIAKNGIGVDEQADLTAKSQSAVEDPEIELDGGEKPSKVVRKRKTKEEKEVEVMPLAARTAGLKMYVGAHVSIFGGLENSVKSALHIGGNAFALFLKNQRRWETPSLKDENRDAFKQHCSHHEYDQSAHVLPHCSYLVNLASPNADSAQKSYDTFVDDLHRCEALGIRYYNFHPGSTSQQPLDEAIARLAGNLNRALAETSTVIPLLENMAGHKSVIGARFSDLRDIIALIKPEFKSRIGICIDTCHAFAAGYDLRSPEAYQATFQELDNVVGLQYLKAMHLNDSKAPLNGHRDLHQNIGVGFLGLRAFHNVMNDVRLQDLPLVLETPAINHAGEIKLLESLIGMDPESQLFKTLEAQLSERGRAEREKMMASIAAREEKAKKKAKKALEKGQKSISSMFGSKSEQKKGNMSSSSELSGTDSDE